MFVICFVYKSAFVVEIFAYCDDKGNKAGDHKYMKMMMRSKMQNKQLSSNMPCQLEDSYVLQNWKTFNTDDLPRFV